MFPHALSVVHRVRGRLRYKRLRNPPVIIGGCERSGTTLLLSVLSAHPSIHAIAGESWAFCYGSRAGFPGDRPIRMGRLYRHLGVGAMRPTARRWCEKSPANVFYFEDLLRHFDGRVRLIHIVRDGRDVVTSIHPSRPDEPTPARRWVAAVSAGLAYLDHPNVLTIRYEDLVTKYDTTVRAACRHGGEAFVSQLSSWLGHATVTRSGTLRSGEISDIYRSSIRKFERPGFPYLARVQALLAEPGATELLQRFGYL